MPTAKILQWPSEWALQRRKAKLRKAENAREFARLVENDGELEIVYNHHSFLGYTDIRAYCRRENRTHWVRLYNHSHFAGAYTKVPEFENGMKIKFRYRGSAIPGGDRNDFSSYLEIEYVR